MTAGPNEDDLANSIIERFDDGDANKPWQSEVPYNHYGDRGVVDLVQRYDGGPGRDQLHIFEFKSERAVVEANGASDILRQFNRHREYFFDGSNYNRYDYFDVIFELAFTATESNLQHVCDNWPQYKTLNEHVINGVTTFVSLRSTDTMTPVLFDERGNVVQQVDLPEVVTV